MLKLWAVTVCILTVVCATGCVTTYDHVVFEVVDDQTQQAIPNAGIVVQLLPNSWLSLNAGKVSLYQAGYTDIAGQWETTVYANCAGIMLVEKAAGDVQYARQEITIDSRTFDDGYMKIALQRE